MAGAVRLKGRVATWRMGAHSGRLPEITRLFHPTTAEAMPAITVTGGPRAPTTLEVAIVLMWRKYLPLLLCFCKTSQSTHAHTITLPLFKVSQPAMLQHVT